METKSDIRIATVVFPLRETAKGGTQVLLGEHTRKVGIGCPTGPGGMVNSGESIREAAARECFEESGISAAPESLSYAGRMLFYNHEQGEVEPSQMLVHFFLANVWYGWPTMKDPHFTNLRWYPTGRLPLDHMMAADPYFVPDMLQGKQIIGRAHYLNSAEVRQKLLYPGTAVLVSESEVTIDVP